VQVGSCVVFFFFPDFPRIVFSTRFFAVLSYCPGRLTRLQLERLRHAVFLCTGNFSHFNYMEFFSYGLCFVLCPMVPRDRLSFLLVTPSDTPSQIVIVSGFRPPLVLFVFDSMGSSPSSTLLLLQHLFFFFFYTLPFLRFCSYFSVLTLPLFSARSTHFFLFPKQACFSRFFPAPPPPLCGNNEYSKPAPLPILFSLGLCPPKVRLCTCSPPSQTSLGCLNPYVVRFFPRLHWLPFHFVVSARPPFAQGLTPVPDVFSSLVFVVLFFFFLGSSPGKSLHPPTMVRPAGSPIVRR